MTDEVRRIPRPRLIVAKLMILAATTVTGGTACARSSGLWEVEHLGLEETRGNGEPE